MQSIVRWSPLVFLLTLGACAEQASVSEAFKALDAGGWNVIEPGGETTCSDGSPFEFYVRPADPEKVVVFFDGGGACWFGETCDLSRNPTYTPVVNRDRSLTQGGIFSFDEAENPFADYTAVYVPYCTGDVHLGDRRVTYDVPARGDLPVGQVTINHRGNVNATSAVDWLTEHVRAPETVFVTGSSAGAIPSPLFAMRVADAYPKARVVQLGDGAGGYRNEAFGSQVFEVWGADSLVGTTAELAGVSPGEVTFETFYAAAAKRHPDVTFAQFNTAEDNVQRDFLALGGVTGVSLQPLLEANYADIEAVVPAFHSYTAGGTLHTILRRPEFYTYRVGGVRFRDWVARLAAGEPVEDVACADCTRPETSPAPAATAGQ